jgi:hypothetical protein
MQIMMINGIDLKVFPQNLPIFPIIEHPSRQLDRTPDLALPYLRIHIFLPEKQLRKPSHLELKPQISPKKKGDQRLS